VAGARWQAVGEAAGADIADSTPLPLTSCDVAPCEECGYEWESLDRGEILPEVATLASEHALLLTSVPADLLREHTRPESWSPLEYACHVRDVLRFQRERIALAQAEDTPEFVPMRRDERAVEERYNDQDPFIVSGEITIAARQLVGALAALDDKGWLRTGRYPSSDPEVRTVEWVGRRTAHELAHHLFDIRGLLALSRLLSSRDASRPRAEDPGYV
jgi:DinB superfamily